MQLTEMTKAALISLVAFTFLVVAWVAWLPQFVSTASITRMENVLVQYPPRMDISKISDYDRSRRQVADYEYDEDENDEEEAEEEFVAALGNANASGSDADLEGQNDEEEEEDEYGEDEEDNGGEGRALQGKSLILKLKGIKFEKQ